MKFCDKLQKIRKENNITQEQLADRLNVSRQAVSKWESGTAYPDTEKLILISKIFNVSLDELINDNKDSAVKSTKKLDFMEILNRVIEFISKSVNMFWSMKFIDKIKCIFEMGILFLIILGVAVMSTSIIGNIIRRIFMFLPGEVVYFICNIVDALLYIAWIILGGIILVKIFRSRYLDYYVVINDNSISEKIIEEPIRELKEKKEYKVVIRDPRDSSLNIFKKIGKLFVYLFKWLCGIVAIPLVLMFIFFMVVLVVSLFFLIDGMFFIGISISIVGILGFIFLMIEFIYNLIFNREHAFSRIFILFIGSISLIGIGLGLSFSDLGTFSFEDDRETYVESHIIDMSDNLVIDEIYYIDDTKIVIDDSIDYIKLDIASYEGSEVSVYGYTNSYYDSNLGLVEYYKEIDIYAYYNDFDDYKRVVSNLREKKFSELSYGFYEIEKVYISRDNLTKIKENYLNYR